MEEVCVKIVGFLIVIGLIFLMAWPIMWIWNDYMVKLFEMPVLTYWEVLGMQIMVRMIIGK